ncbi:COX assembly mitochondrial protein [Fasciolopsis buskii]|uniref:COX assembly mitochondrial protein n=1 Tax=Fasciolopsis buskii TaxID=27845 RepID=A0A8E0RW00_9TREM|nr:COX assembly mitochondrial protein [Fasciolopsis buski]
MSGYDTYKGGPVNQGDPDSQYMSDAERGSVFSRFVQYKLLTTLCEPQWRQWRECIKAKRSEWFSTYKCRGDFNLVNECQNKYILDAEQMKVLEKEYLELRSEFRRTGVGHQFMTKDQLRKYFAS